VVELPFLHAIGIPTRYQGHLAIRESFNFVGGTLFPDFGFKPEDINVLIETPSRCSPSTLPTRRRRTLGVFSITCSQGDLSPKRPYSFQRVASAESRVQRQNKEPHMPWLANTF
jgi:hypothetical protein